MNACCQTPFSVSRSIVRVHVIGMHSSIAFFPLRT